MEYEWYETSLLQRENKTAANNDHQLIIAPGINNLSAGSYQHTPIRGAIYDNLLTYQFCLSYIHTASLPQSF